MVQSTSECIVGELGDNTARCSSYVLQIDFVGSGKSFRRLYTYTCHTYESCDLFLAKQRVAKISAVQK